ncbi:hypothetical protein Pcinc_015346 [Petrolisthes cinctipes]|uniref:BTB domain-containing protein n=1 Tax=Petrolisthes cinctipes TaxID=88211 RepID=A0AAE1KN85_PETCI|nr:hypothetical protein Pcinc_015346 [Petrolisthes cinctipes]
MADGALVLMWKNHHAAFCDILTRLRERGTFTDVTLVCEGKFYPVHKLVLSACSEHLEKILENTQCRHPTIVLHGIKCCDLEQLLMYMYTGEVSVLQRSLSQLMQAAELLEIKGLAIPDKSPAANIVKENTKEKSSRERSVSPPSKRRKHKDQNSNHEGTGQAWNSPLPEKTKEKSTSPENNKQKYKDRSSNQGKDGQEVCTSPLTSISSKHPPEGQEDVEHSPSRYSQQPKVGREELPVSPERHDSKRPCAGKSETDDEEILVKEEVEEEYCPDSVASPDVMCQAGDDGINTSPAFLKDDGSMLVNTWSNYEVGQTPDHSSLQSHHQHHGMTSTQNKQWGGEREVGSETHNSRMGDSELLPLASDPPDALLHNQQVMNGSARLGVSEMGHKCRGGYMQWTPEERIQIAQVCSALGPSKAARELSKKFRKKLSKSTVRNIHKRYTETVAKTGGLNMQASPTSPSPLTPPLQYLHDH